MTARKRRPAADPRTLYASHDSAQNQRHGGARTGSGRHSVWLSCPSVPIRVPQRFAAELLAIAHDMDTGKPVFTTINSNDRTVAEALAILAGDLARIGADRKATLNRTRIKAAWAALEHYQSAPSA